MSLTVAVQMDPIERINIAGDSTFALMLEAQARGHTLYYYTADKLSMRDGRITAPAFRIEVRDVMEKVATELVDVARGLRAAA